MDYHLNLLNNSEVGGIIIPIFQRRKKRLTEPSYLAQVTQLVGRVSLSPSVVSHGGLVQSLASRKLMMLPFSFLPGITEGDPTCERVKSEIPSRACKTPFPPLASSLSVPSLEFPTVCCQHPPPAPQDAVPLSSVPLLMLFPLSGTLLPFYPLMNKSEVHSGTTPPGRLP